MIIKNGLVYTNSKFESRDLHIDAGIFTDKAEGSIVDAEGCYVIPGLIDIHFHGCMGQDFSNASIKAIETIAKYEASQGITTICPASMTLSAQQITKICETAAAYANQHTPCKQALENQRNENWAGATLCGINLEGPFLSEAKKGAQNGAYLQRADRELFQQWQNAANGLIKLISIAPEYPENMAFIKEMHHQVRISLAHTTADYDTAVEAFQSGASHVTHLFNAMNPFTHRAPGVPGAAHDCKDTMIELICDGIHIHPGMIRTTFSIYGADRIILISDSMEATGMPDGTFQLGGQAVTVKGNLATLKDGTIAGSVTNLIDCVRYLVKEVGIPLETAIKCAAVNPAKAIRVYDRYGSLDAGKVANFVLLDKELNLKGVYLNGEKIELPK